jgi:adenylate cyclase
MFVITLKRGGALRQWQLAEGDTIIGRGADCDVVINDDSVSRRHARLVVQGDRVRLSDLDSANGTRRNGSAVRNTDVVSGDVLVFGDVTATLERVDNKPASVDSGARVLSEPTLMRRFDALPGGVEPIPAIDAPRLIRLLAEIARTLVGTLALEDILNRVVDLLLAHVPAERGCVLLPDSATHELVPRIMRRLDDDTAWQPVISRILIELILKQRVAVLTSDVRRDERFDASQSIYSSDVRSLICGPLYAGDELIGVLYADNPVARQFSEADLEIFSALANYAAVAITQARLTARLTKESRHRERLERYHSPAVVERVLAAQDRADVLVAQERDVSVLFADIVGFTTMAEAQTPTQVAALLNTFFSRMTDVVFDEHGTVDKFDGDAILAVFGAPFDQPDHARRAVVAAQTMRREIARLNADGALPGVRVRYAINSGVAIAGDFGSMKRREYTVLGDVVNIAARLATIAEPDQIVISRATCDRVQPPIAAHPLGTVLPRGRTSKVEIFCVDP